MRDGSIRTGTYRRRRFSQMIVSGQSVAEREREIERYAKKAFRSKVR